MQGLPVEQVFLPGVAFVGIGLRKPRNGIARSGVAEMKCYKIAYSFIGHCKRLTARSNVIMFYSSGVPADKKQLYAVSFIKNSL